jgi:hypothetical protein
MEPDFVAKLLRFCCAFVAKHHVTFDIIDTMAIPFRKRQPTIRTNPTRLAFFVGKPGHNKISMDQIQQHELDRWQLKDWAEAEYDRSNYQSSTRPIVIGGCGRSGTTLLRVMLDSHSQIAAGPESLLFLPVVIDFPALAYKFDLDEALLRRTYQACASRSAFIDAFQALYLAQSGRAIWADKTARNVHVFAEILNHFPQAKLLHVIRDGRDVIASLLTHRKRKIVDGQLQPTGYRMPLQNCIDRWLMAISDGIKLRGHPNYMEVRYEDLVKQPEATIHQVCQFLAVDFELEMLEFHKFSGPSRDYRRFPQNMEATMPLYSSSLGRWRTDLTHKELTTIMSAIHPQLEMLGYNY